MTSKIRAVIYAVISTAMLLALFPAQAQTASFQTVWAVSNTFIVSEDGGSITARVRFIDGDTRDYYYHWQR